MRKSLCEALSVAAANKKAIGLDSPLENKLIVRISDLSDKLFTEVEKLERDRAELKKIKDVEKVSVFNKDIIISDMAKIRTYVDELEKIVAKEYWPYPTYADLLFGVK